MATDGVHRYIDAHREDSLGILKTLIRQPSISAQNTGVKECAQVLIGIMRDLGVPAEVIQTPTQPVVLGELRRDPKAYTLLLYGHYDVQPPEPLDLWQSPPFEPTIRDGRLYGRGTGDNKGQLITHVLAAKAWMEAAGGPPINLKFIFEGEEESGSPGLAGFVQTHRERLGGRPRLHLRRRAASVGRAGDLAGQSRHPRDHPGRAGRRSRQPLGQQGWGGPESGVDADAPTRDDGRSVGARLDRGLL